MVGGGRRGEEANKIIRYAILDRFQPQKINYKAPGLLN